jgi:phosphogluconate dehydratase
MGFLMRELAQAGYLHQDVTTIMGEGLEPYFKEPELVQNSNADIYHSNPTMTNSKYKVNWIPSPLQSLDDSVVRTADLPFSQEGGLKLLTGNLGRSVIKISAVAEQHRIVEAPAIVFNSQEEFQQSFDAKELERDFIAVIRFQGPKTNGMPELHKLTPLLGIQQDNGFKVAIVTDGRMSGASGKIPAAIHLVPEATEGGLIAKIQNGDLIRLDGVNGELSLLISAEEIKSRELLTLNDLPEHSSARNNSYGVGRELFEVFRQNVSSAEQGATIF